MGAEPTIDVLIVDDNPHQLTALRVILAELGANVVCVRSGRDALRSLLHQDFAAILLDVNMPTMDGFETAHLIRQRPRSEHTPIIFITAFADETHVARGYSLGAVDYILTPVVPEVLRAKVAVFIELFRKSQEVRRQADSLRRRAAQLHALTEASLAIHEAPSIERMLPIVTERACAIVGAQFAAVRVRFEDGRSHEGEARTPECAARWSRAVLDAALERADATAACPRLPSAGRTTTRADLDGSLAVTLTGRDGSNLGVLVVAERHEGEFTDGDAALLRQLGQMASIAAENTLYGEEREANRIKDEFLATVSHELRTPLTAMLSWIRLLQGGTLDAAETQHALEVIDRNARAQSRLVDDLLDMSRIVTGKLQIVHETVELDDVVGGAIESLRPAAAAKGISLRVALADDAPVVGDARRLQQVMWNLLSNAIKFTPRDGSVDVRMRRDGETAEIRVTDTGPGISPAFLPHVFDRFRQADTSTSRSHGGLGLGLAIVRHLVELHGGTVVAENGGEQRGASFVVRLPLASRVVTPPAVGSANASGTIALDGLRVLVVEDDGDGREALTMLLTTAGAQVVAVASARAALTAIADEVPDVLVSDIGLPGEDGYALIRDVRALAEERGGAIPAIAVTAYAHSQDRARAIAAGYQAHVAKPVDAAKLLDAIATNVPARRAQARAV